LCRAKKAHLPSAAGIATLANKLQRNEPRSSAPVALQQPSSVGPSCQPHSIPTSPNKASTLSDRRKRICSFLCRVWSLLLPIHKFIFCDNTNKLLGILQGPFVTYWCVVWILPLTCCKCELVMHKCLHYAGSRRST
jgi:hypothetical protein